ncbi:hypothetical protein F5877DRAFT_74023 [Lentinula edodes]|nr:hypothetical protein F5877DRAFT_74023 [Lentinula edodes]
MAYKMPGTEILSPTFAPNTGLLNSVPIAVGSLAGQESICIHHSLRHLVNYIVLRPLCPTLTSFDLLLPSALVPTYHVVPSTKSTAPDMSSLGLNVSAHIASDLEVLMFDLRNSETGRDNCTALVWACKSQRTVDQCQGTVSGRRGRTSRFWKLVGIHHVDRSLNTPPNSNVLERGRIYVEYLDGKVDFGMDGSQKVEEYRDALRDGLQNIAYIEKETKHHLDRDVTYISAALQVTEKYGFLEEEGVYEKVSKSWDTIMKAYETKALCTSFTVYLVAG